MAEVKISGSGLCLLIGDLVQSREASDCRALHERVEQSLAWVTPL